MTRYFFDRTCDELLATWDSGVGGTATRVCAFAHNVEVEAGLSAGAALAEHLTALSAAAWRTYTHGGRFTEPGETNTEAWRLAEDRKDFDEVAQMIADPGDPHLWPYSPVLSSAKSTGQLLATLDTSEVSAAVLREVDVELAAVTNAELGDLSGRAAQAVVLTRWSGSPTQVQAAWDLLDADPLGTGASMKTMLDPTSACIAAAAWLRGAAGVASDESGTNLPQVIAEADDIEALPVMSPLEVLRRLDDGATPTQAVTELIAEAQKVADGLLPDVEGLKRRLATLDELIERVPESRDDLIAEAKLCLLDPSRPGPDLLEDLLSGIWGCFLVWNEYTWDQREPPGLTDDDEITPDQSEQMDIQARQEFSDLVQDAMADVDRLSL